MRGGVFPDFMHKILCTQKNTTQYIYVYVVYALRLTVVQLNRTTTAPIIALCTGKALYNLSLSLVAFFFVGGLLYYIYDICCDFAYVYLLIHSLSTVVEEERALHRHLRVVVICLPGVFCEVLCETFAFARTLYIGNWMDACRQKAL